LTGPDAPGGDAPAPPPHPGSLCHACAAHRYIHTKSSTFVMCTALPVKYPRQPVSACPAFRPADPAPEAR
jgi:hypothetical protein